MSEESLIMEIEKMYNRAKEPADGCEKRILRKAEVRNELVSIDRQLQSVLPKDSVAYRIFDRRRLEHTDWSIVGVSGYVDNSDLKNVKYRIETMNEILEFLDPEFLQSESRRKTQFYFEPGDSYNPRKKVFNILKSASKNVAIIDQYLDADVFDYIESLYTTINILLITGSHKPIFPKLLHDLQRKFVNLEARECNQCHDRFLIIDSDEIWNMGTSLNGTGKKAFMINKVTEPIEVKRFLEDFNDWWNNGQVL